MNSITSSTWTYTSKSDEIDLRKHREIRKNSNSTFNKVSSYQDLVMKVANLGFKNKSYFLLFRGQCENYETNRGASSIFPTLFRPEKECSPLTTKTKRERWELLEKQMLQLTTHYPANSEEDKKIKRVLTRNKELAWTVLQHYEKCATPYLDLTHSLRVAASFATNNSTSGYVYVIGMPYPQGAISHFIDQDMVLINLQSACPPVAKRPHFQEGWLAGSYYLNEYSQKSAQNFSRRLIAKFYIGDRELFWSDEFPCIPNDSLLPENDKTFPWVSKLLK